MKTFRLSSLSTALALTATLPLTASGATYSLTANDASGASSFTNFNVSGTTKYGAPSAENDYYVGFASGAGTIRTPTSGTSHAFAGKSMTFGNAESSQTGAMALTSPTKSTITFQNEGAVLSRGRWMPYTNNRQFTFAGTITIASPSGYPFLITQSQGSNYGTTNILTATIKGASGTEFVIGNENETAKGLGILYPEDASQFYGQLTIGKISDYPGSPYRKSNVKYPADVQYNGSKTWAGTIRVRPDSMLKAQYASTKWTIGNLVLDSGSTLHLRVNQDAISTLTLTNSISVADGAVLQFGGAPGASDSAARSWTVMTLPEDKGEIPLDSFTVSGLASFPAALPCYTLSTNTSSGLSTLNLAKRQIVRLVADNTLSAWRDTGFDTAITNAASWSDNAVPHGDADYVVDTANYHLCFPPTDLLTESTYAFPGSSLTIGNGSGQVDVYSAADTVDIGILRMLNNGRFWPLCHVSGSQTVTVNGQAIHLLATGNGQSYFRIYGNRLVVVNAPLTGAGRLTVFNNSSTSAAKSGTILFAADNKAFTGRIRLSAGAKDGVYSPNTLLVTAGDQLGGDLNSFTYDALELRFGSILAATNDVTLSAANRGVYVNSVGAADAAGVMDVADGATLALESAVVTFADGVTLAKIGSGTLALGGSVSNENASATGTLAVRAGYLQALSTNAVNGVAVTFADGAYLLVDPATTGDLATYGAVNLSANPFDGSLPVAFKLPAIAENEEYRCSDVAVATVADAATAQTLAASASVKKIRGHNVAFSTRINADGTATILASIGKNAFMLIVR